MNRRMPIGRITVDVFDDGLSNVSYMSYESCAYPGYYSSMFPADKVPITVSEKLNEMLTDHNRRKERDKAA